MIQKISCTAPYWINHESNSTSYCTNTRQLKQFHEMEIEEYMIPCRRLTQIAYSYSESQSNWYDTLFQNAFEDYFYVSIMFQEPTYKQILLLRSFDIQSLIGNAGGYIGICVGYSFYQLPILLDIIYRKIQRLLIFYNNSVQPEN